MNNVRVITTVGHVDHGKTTFVDSLLAANNIISSRMAGKIRYMDSREDEQQRGITMESSAVSLQFKIIGADAATKNYVVNLIDTPGHVDFSSEVSTAARLCDGALVLVDAVEGVCTQTVTVLRQAWIDRLKPILVLNKLDRLVTELKLTPIEGYHHIIQVIEQVNAIMGSFFAGDRLEDDLRWREEREKRLAAKRDADADSADTDEVFQEKDDEDLYFAPDRGNVIFASAIDGWGFRVGHFAQMYAQKLGVKEANLRRVLWGDFFLDPKTKRVISHKHLRGRNLKPLFVQFVLDNIWAVYENVVLKPNPEKVDKILSTLNLKIQPRDLKSKDSKHVAALIFSQWLPLATCTVQAVVDVIPPPSVAQRIRVPKMLHPNLPEDAFEPKTRLEHNVYSCDASPEACVVAYVSKMFAVPRKELPEFKKRVLTADEMRQRGRAARDASAGDPKPVTPDNQANSPAPDSDVDDCLLGFARLYSGTISVGTTIACVLPKFKMDRDPTDAQNAKHIITTGVVALYTMMGRELVPGQTVSAGNVFAIAGLEGKVWRNATLCAPKQAGCERPELLPEDSEWLVNLGSVNRQTQPIVRFAVEPVESADMPKLIHGLRLLSQSDPCVETFQQATGEHVILTAGELHAERCLKDLRERFARVDIHASIPIVPFRETAVKAADLPPPKAGAGAARGTVHGSIAQSLVTFSIRAAPLPGPIVDFLLTNAAILRAIADEQQTNQPSDATDRDDPEVAEGEVFRTPTIRAEDFASAFERICKEIGGEWATLHEKLWSFGPQRVGANVLVDGRNGLSHRRIHSKFTQDKLAPSLLRDIEDAVELGFQLATFQGPMCAEPMQGMAFFLENLQYEQESIMAEGGQIKLTGSLISAVKEACRNGLLDWSPRLMLAMYTCDIQASTDVLGKVYGVVARRRGRIVSEEMREGTHLFTVNSMLPVVESFGFADEIRKKTSGAASPQLVFSGYEILDQDPFWVPSTEEELEDLGEKSDRANVARVYMDGVRGRKGMFVEKKIVEFAEKQRTLKR